MFVGRAGMASMMAAAGCRDEEIMRQGMGCLLSGGFGCVLRGTGG